MTLESGHLQVPMSKQAGVDAAYGSGALAAVLISVGLLRKATGIKRRKAIYRAAKKQGRQL